MKKEGEGVSANGGRIFRRPTLDGAGKKGKGSHARKRDVVVNFRVTREEKELIDRRIGLSGLHRNEFFIQSCLYQAILVRGNVKTFEKIRERLKALARESGLADLSADPAAALELRTIAEMLRYVQKRNGS